MTHRERIRCAGVSRVEAQYLVASGAEAQRVTRGARAPALRVVRAGVRRPTVSATTPPAPPTGDTLPHSFVRMNERCSARVRKKLNWNYHSIAVVAVVTIEGNSEPTLSLHVCTNLHLAALLCCAARTIETIVLTLAYIYNKIVRLY